MASGTTWHHGVALVVSETGVLILGRAGSGKTSLARAMLAEASQRGLYARLVGDDRVSLTPINGRLVARPHARTAGLIEHRGSGIRSVVHDPACVLRLVVELVLELAQLNERHPDVVSPFIHSDVSLPRLVLFSGWSPVENSRRVFEDLPFGPANR